MAGNAIEPGIRELGPKVYEVRVGMGRDENGRLVQRSRTVRGPLKEARRVRAEMLLAAGISERPRLVSVAELGERWLADLERRGKSPNTVHGYRSKWKHIDRHLGTRRIDQVTTVGVNNLYSLLAKWGLAAQ